MTDDARGYKQHTIYRDGRIWRCAGYVNTFKTREEAMKAVDLHTTFPSGALIRGYGGKRRDES